MRSFVPAIYDVTVAIPKSSPQPTMLRLFKGQSSVVSRRNLESWIDLWKCQVYAVSWDGCNHCISGFLLIYTKPYSEAETRERLTNRCIQLGTEAFVSFKLEDENPIPKLSRANNCMLLLLCSYSQPSNHMGEVGTFFPSQDAIMIHRVLVQLSQWCSVPVKIKYVIKVDSSAFRIMHLLLCHCFHQ